MKFRINTTGSIVEPNDETVLEQMKNSPSIPRSLTSRLTPRKATTKA